MDYDFSEDVAKIWPATARSWARFVVVVGGLLFVLDILPRWGKGKERLQMFGFLGPALVLLGDRPGLPADPHGRRCRSTTTPAARSSGWTTTPGSFTHADTLIMLRNTLFWVVCVPLLATAFGLLYAVLVDKARGEKLAKSLIFMPMAISLVGASIIWKFIYAYREADEEQIGLLNQILVWLGLEPQQFLTRRAVEHLLPDRHDDLDPGRLRDGHPVRRDQGDPRRDRRGGPARRRRPAGRCSARSPCRASGPRSWWSSSPSPSAR